LLRPSARPPRVRLRHKFGAMLRFTAAVFRSIDPRAERPPLPDFKLANIGGAIIPRLGKRWRPTCPVKASRPSR
jgi:hypothetical protein